MGIIDKIRKQPADKASKGAAAPKKTAKKEVDVTVKAPVTTLPGWMYELVGKPRVSEKASRLIQETSTYTFNVPIDAEKIAIRKAIEARYSVKVSAVRTIRGAGKKVSRGRISGQRNRWKKAMVELAPGQTLDLSAS